MTQDTFKAMILTQENGATRHEIKELTVDDLPENDVLVNVEYSSLNYKDAMAITGTGKIVRSWPIVPGIDLVGKVEESGSSNYKPGDRVVLTGWGVGEKYWGGYTQKQRVRPEWLVKLPEGFEARHAMAVGTAGFTAMLCVMSLEEAGLTPEKGTVLVTGAVGGVGSVAISILSNLGYETAALTVPGQEDTHDYLRSLGASEIIGGPEWSEKPRPLETQRWAGAVDTVGTIVLARVLAETHYGGTVANCGLAGGTDLPTTVMPFILRGVSLRGVDSVMCPIERRKEAWERLGKDLSTDTLNQIERVVSLKDAPRQAENMMAGQSRGRVVIDVNA